MDIKAEELEFKNKNGLDLDGAIKSIKAMEGRKDDKDKARMDLIPPEALFALADILGYGAKKYGEYNWCKGMDWSRVYSALQRHLNAWWAGEPYDEETKQTHLAHAICCVAFLLSYEKCKIGKDDRPTYAKQNTGV